MLTRMNQPFSGARLSLLASAIVVVITAGCSGKPDRLERAYQEVGLTKTPVAPVAGSVAVDGSAPEPFTVVMLWEPKKPDAGVLRTICDSQGHFEFTSYEHGDGVPPGTYVMLFASFHMGGKLGNFEGPDLLHNLYNDPDKNASLPEFQITVSAPGKSDYQFNLNVAGATPATPGPHSVTELRPAT
jgi:hypothetical protein